MERHSYDPVSGLLAVIAIAAGVAVANDQIARIDGGLAWVLGIGALLLGLTLLPWGRRARRDDDPTET